MQLGLLLRDPQLMSEVKWYCTVSQIPKNEPVNDQKPAADLPIVLNNNKNDNKLSLTVIF